MNGKHIALILFLGILFTGSAAGQTRISPKFGFNFSALNTELDTIRSKGRSGWNIGLDLRIERRQFFFHPGFHYQKITAELKNIDLQSPQFDLREETTINSVKIPLNAGFYLTGEGGLLRAHVRGGLVPQFVVGVTERDKFDFDRDRLNGFSWAANAGIGVDFLLLTVDFSYELGLSNFYKDHQAKNRMAVLSFGFIF